MRFFQLACVAITLFAAGLLPASATTVTQTVNFTASGFVPFVPAAPVNPVTGSFTFTFDPALTSFNDTSIITNSLNISVAGVGFDYVPGADLLTIGGQVSGIPAVGVGTNDFLLVLGGFVDGPLSPTFRYSQGGFVYTATNVEISAVPLPPAFVLMMSALGALALIALRQSRRATAS